MKTRTIVFAIITMTWVGGVSHAGDLTVIGNLGVASNLTANALAVNTVSLGGIARTNWPSGGTTTASVTDLSTAVLDFSQPGRFYRYTLTGDVTWVLTNHVAGKQVWLQVAQDSTGGYGNSWPADLLWPAGSAQNGSTAANSFSVFKILDNGSNWLAQAEGLSYSAPCTSCNYALQFDGSQNYVATPSDSFTLSGDLTFEAWFKSSSVGSAAMGAFGMGEHWGSSGWLYCAGGVAGKSWLQTLGGNIDPLPDLSDSNWHHIAFVQSNGSTYAYYDGSLVGSSGAALLSCTSDFTIGAEPGASGWYCHGTLDEVRISSTARYTDTFDPCTAVNFTVDENTVAYWKFNEGSGTTAADSSGNSNNGTLSGTTVPTWVSGGTCSGGSMNMVSRGGGSMSMGRGTSGSSISLTNSSVTLTNSPVNGSSITITDTLGRVWGLLSHP